MVKLTVKMFPTEVTAGVALPHMAVQFVPQEDTLLEREPGQVRGGGFGVKKRQEMKRQRQTLHYYCHLPHVAYGPAACSDADVAHAS